MADDALPFAKDRKPDLPKPGPRKALNRVQILQLAIRQNLKCGCGCGAPLDPVCIDEHMVPRETLPADRCDHIDNRALLNPPCAKTKTKGDQAVIGHWRRARGESGQAKRRKERDKPLIQSRGFDRKEAPTLPDRGMSQLSRSPGSWQSKPEGVSTLSKSHPNYRKPKWQTRKA